MMKKIFGIGLFLFGATLNTTFAGTGDYSPSRGGINSVDNIFGTNNSIEFNRFTDDTFLGQRMGQIPRTSAATGCPSPITAECLRTYARNNGLRRYMDERDFVSARISGDPAYDHTVNGIGLGDEIRVFVYAHNNAMQGVPGNAALNTNVTVDWSDPRNVVGSINASNAVPNTINDIVDLGLPAGTTLEFTGNAFHAANAGAFSSPSAISASSTTATSATFNLGNVASCYSHTEGVWVDFRVVNVVPAPSISVAKVDNNPADQDGTNGSAQPNVEFDNATKTVFAADDSQTISSGSDATFRIIVTNNGNVPLTNVRLNDALTASCTQTDAQTQPRYTGASFAPGDSFQYECTQANVTADYVNEITVTADSVGGSVSETDRSQVVVVASTEPSISVAKVDNNPADQDGTNGSAQANIEFDNATKTVFAADDSQTITSGSDATFRIIVTNNGAIPLTNVRLSDALTAACTQTDAQTQPRYTGASFAPGDSFQYECTQTNVTADYVNEITVTADSVGGSVSETDRSEVLISTVTPGPSITIDKDDSTPGTVDADGDDTQTINAGGTANFTITVTNDGTESLQNVVLTDAEALECAGAFEAPSTRPGNWNNFAFTGDADNLFDPAETFTFTCTQANVQVGDFTDGPDTDTLPDNDVTVNAVGVTSNTPVTATDETEVIVDNSGTFCGDGTVQNPNGNGDAEQCDDGNTIDDDGCSNQCTLPSTCGNGIIEAPEQCDNGALNGTAGNACSATCTTGGGPGGGGPEVISSVGTCAVGGNGAWQCRSSRPNDNNNALWDEYRACKSGNLSLLDDIIVADFGTLNRSEKNCAYAFVVADGKSICGARLHTGAIDPFENSNGNGDISECNPIPLLPGVVANTGCASCFKGGAWITKEAVQDTIARGDTVDYKLTLDLGLEDVTHYQVVNAEVRFYDFTIPSVGGNLWGKAGLSDGWSLAPAGGKYFLRDLNSTELNNINSAGGAHIELEYTMNSELATTADQASIDNVAFAVVDYEYEHINCGENCPSNGSKKLLIANKVENNPNAVSENLRVLDNAGARDVDYASFSSLGDIATVRIIRPFVQARNGGNIGFDFNEDRTEKVTATEDTITGNDDGGTIFIDTDVDEDLLSSFDADNILDNFDNVTTFQDGSTDQYYENLRFNTIPQSYAFGGNQYNFEKTPIQDIYFYDDANDVEVGGSIDLNDQNKTFIIEGGADLVVNDDINVSNGYIAFVVRDGGNIIIDPNVTSLEGIFITESGRIESKGDEISRVQLNVKGALMGDMSDLLNDRRFIGDNPSLELQPSVEVEFDLRLLNDTPPALEQFLGSEWGESIQ